MAPTRRLHPQRVFPTHSRQKLGLKRVRQIRAQARHSRIQGPDSRSSREPGSEHSRSCQSELARPFCISRNPDRRRRARNRPLRILQAISSDGAGHDLAAIEDLVGLQQPGPLAALMAPRRCLPSRQGSVRGQISRSVTASMVPPESSRERQPGPTQGFRYGSQSRSSMDSSPGVDDQGRSCSLNPHSGPTGRYTVSGITRRKPFQ